MLMLWSSPTRESGQAPYGFLPAVVRSGQQSKYLMPVQCEANIVKLGLHQCWLSGQQTSKVGKTNLRSVGRGMPYEAKLRFAEP